MRNYFIRRFLRAIYSKVYGLYRILKWASQSFIIRSKYLLCNNSNTPIVDHILILAPHSDDEWVGCSQLLSNNNLEVVVCDMDMQGGDNPTCHNERKMEMAAVSKLFERELFSFREKIDKEIALEELLKYYSPEYVCIPFLLDWHKEHRELMRILYNVLSKKYDWDFKVCMYQVSVPILPSMINYNISMNFRKWVWKWNIFKKYYKSQVHIPYVRFAFNEYINGKINNSFASESFCILPNNEWFVLFKKSLIMNDEMGSLAQSINNLRAIRTNLLPFYRDLFEGVM